MQRYNEDMSNWDPKKIYNRRHQLLVKTEDRTKVAFKRKNRIL